MLNPYLEAFLFGIAIATAVGPIALWIVHTGMSSGAAAGLGCAMGAALADLTYALLAFTIGSSLSAQVQQHEGTADLVTRAALIGAGLWIVIGALRRHDGAHAPDRAPAPGSRATRFLATTYLITLVNPLTMVAFVGFAGGMPLAGSPTRAIGFALALFAGSLAIQVVFALGGAGLGRLLSDPRWIRGLNLVSGVALILFGLRPSGR